MFVKICPICKLTSIETPVETRMHRMVIYSYNETLQKDIKGYNSKFNEIIDLYVSF